MEFLFNIFDPSPMKIRIQLSLFWKNALKYSSAKFNFIISSTLAKITSLDKFDDSAWLSLFILLSNVVSDWFKLFFKFSAFSWLIFKSIEMSFVIFLSFFAFQNSEFVRVLSYPF